MRRFNLDFVVLNGQISNKIIGFCRRLYETFQEEISF